MVDRFRQNRMFQNNQRVCYRALNQEGERYNDDQPDAEELKKFWEAIWSESVDHNRDAKWLKDLQSEGNVTKQEKVNIIMESLKKILGRMPNCNSPSPDFVQRFLLKNFSSLYWRVRSQLKECSDSGSVSSWLTKGSLLYCRKIKVKAILQVIIDLWLVCH